jgi:hypothetical protein
MIIPVHKPFERFVFNDHSCFLSGEVTTADDKLSVFPEWIMADYDLADKAFKLLDDSITSYSDIKVPCAPFVRDHIAGLEKEIQTAFNSGYDAVKELDEIKLFQWIAKLVYGVVYHEIKTGLRTNALNVQELDFSQSLLSKLSNLHLMLQSLIRPVVFEGVVPWTILIFPVDNPPNTFSYRDEINTFTFSLKMKDFGIIACLQDNSASRNYHRQILGKVGDNPLHPIQFEELCAKFFYSAYLFNRLPQYTILPTEEAVYVEPMPLLGIAGKPVFDIWQNKVYGQVLENFWKPWGFILFEIIKDPENPMGFLLDENGEFRAAESITLEIKTLPAPEQ